MIYDIKKGGFSWIDLLLLSITNGEIVAENIKRVEGYKQRRGGERRETWIDFEIRSCPCTHSWIARNISETSWTALTVPFPGQKQAAYWSFKFRITGSEMETCMPLKTAFLVHFSPRDRFSSIPLCPPFEPKPSFASRDIQINDPNRGWLILRCCFHCLGSGVILSATQTVIFNDLRSLIPILERLIWRMYFSNGKYFNSWIFEGLSNYFYFRFQNSDIQSYGLINFRIKIYKLWFLLNTWESRDRYFVE